MGAMIPIPHCPAEEAETDTCKETEQGLEPRVACEHGAPCCFKRNWTTYSSVKLYRIQVDSPLTMN